MFVSGTSISGEVEGSTFPSFPLVFCRPGGQILAPVAQVDRALAERLEKHCSLGDIVAVEVIGVSGRQEVAGSNPAWCDPVNGERASNHESQGVPRPGIEIPL